MGAPNGIYFAAVVHDKTDPTRAPYVSTPLGPYHPDELDRIEYAKIWLRDTYATEDIRRAEPVGGDFMDARALVLAAVQREAEQVRRAAELMQSEAALESVRDETCRWLTGYGIDVSAEDLDAVLEALGVNPRDV
ncbi:hypothetical protein SEA_BOGOTA_69 [Streptomyces phage Bogota]|nr:hypothetical protein SEA_BOGOTA_69 [Streptomyces phage Bogota]